MVEIGGRPILWHIMRIYAHYGYDEFVVALGYKSDYIKRWMLEYSTLQGDLTVSLKDGQVRVLEASARTGRSPSSTSGSRPRPATSTSRTSRRGRSRGSFVPPASSRSCSSSSTTTSTS